MATIPESLAMAIERFQKGRRDAAALILREIVMVEPNHATALHYLGMIALQAGDFVAAANYLRRACEANGDDAVCHGNLGNALRGQGKLDEAIASLRRAVELKPTFAEAHYNLANIYQQQGRLDAAESSFRRAVERKPDFVEACNNLGSVLQAQGKLEEAVDSFREALRKRPAYATALRNLGAVLQAQGKFEEAANCQRRAVELSPNNAAARYNLGNALRAQGEIEEAVACYRQALQLSPNYIEAHQNLLLTLQYRPGVTLAELAEEHAEFERRHTAPLQSRWPVFTIDSDVERPIRVGFVSPNLNQHPVGNFLVPVLENIDRAQCTAVCYSDRANHDDVTRRCQAAAAEWRDVNELDDERLFQLIRGDGIDVLFDLAGHAAKNRLLVFARKPASVQVTWAGYVGTTGLAAMDYILADRDEIPPEAEVHYVERVLRMPEGYVCYEPPSDAPDCSSLPALTSGQVTFGSFNNPAKIGPRVIELWVKILQRVERSRLVLKYRGMDDTSIRARWTHVLVNRGIDPARVEYLGWSSHEDLLKEYQRIDMALDPFPYNGGITTCEALWMGVPVITRPGETFASRHSLSHLSNAGLEGTIAGDEDEYVELAVSLAGDLPRLASLRAGLRMQIAGSSLCDGKRFASDLTRLLREIWRQRGRGKTAE